MSNKAKSKSNLPPDWRLEPPPEGDFRYLGHPSHDARGFLKKHSQNAPWVLMCMCGRSHRLPQLPELSVGVPVMIFAIDAVKNPKNASDLNGEAGKIYGQPDRDGCYPIKLSRTGEVVLLPPSMLKTQVFTLQGTMYDGRKEFKSRAVEDEEGRQVLPPLPTPKKMAVPKKKKPNMGLFLRNFSMFIQDGIKVERYGSHGPVTIEYPQTGVSHPIALLWMDTALSTLILGVNKDDPYKARWDLRLVTKIVCWNDGDTLSDYGHGNKDDWSTDGDTIESERSLVDDFDFRGGGGGGGGGGSCGGAVVRKSKARASSQWREPVGRLPQGSMRRDLTLVISDKLADDESWTAKLDPVVPTFVHLRMSSTKVRLYVATCLASLTEKPITEEVAPEFRGARAVVYDPPPLGKPKDHQKALIGMKPLVHRGKLNWSPYVALRRFNKLQFDADGFVSRILLPECEVEMDFTDLGCVLGVRLLEMNFYFNEALTGDLAMTTNCPQLERLNLGNCTEITGDLSCFDKCHKTLTMLDLHWCRGVRGELESFRHCIHLVNLNLSGIEGLTGRLEALREMSCLEELQLTGGGFQGDLIKAFGKGRMKRLRVLSLEGCKDVVGDIGVVLSLPLLEQLRLSGCKRLHGDVSCFTVGPPIDDADGFYDSGDRHFDRDSTSALQYLGGGDDGDGGGVTIAVHQGLAPASFNSLLGLQLKEEHDSYGLFDNRHHGKGPDQRPLSHLTEVGLHNCRGVTGDAAVFASVPLLAKLVLWKTQVALSEAYGSNKAALKRILPPTCVLLI